MLKLLLLLSICGAVCCGHKSSRFNVFTRPRLGHEAACLVTANLLYSHGYFVRELSIEEQSELIHYEQELDNYNKQLADFLHTAYIAHPPAINWIYGSRVVLPSFQHSMPRRPALPSFCSGRDTQIYKLNGCIVQNYRIYIGSLYVRQLSDDERRELDEYEYRLKEYQTEIVESMRRPRGQHWDPDHGWHDDDSKSFEKDVPESMEMVEQPRPKPSPALPVVEPTSTSTTTTTAVPEEKPVEKPTTSLLPPQTPKFCSQLY